MKKQTKEQLKNASQKYLEEWEIRHSELPEYLWHYTNIAGVKGILSGRNLWFSHAAFLNDSSELSYAVDVAVKTTRARLENETEALVKEYLENFLTKIQADRTNQQIFGFTTPVFVACFCREGDSLHLWRAYTGNGRGYSIGFFPESVLDNLKPLRINETLLVDHATGEVRPATKIYRASLREVIYNPKEQEETLKKVIDSFCQIVVNNKSEFPSGNLNNFSKMIFIQELASVFLTICPVLSIRPSRKKRNGGLSIPEARRMSTIVKL